jgi:hypothetical protein
MRIKLKNIILSIWIEGWDKKNQLKFYKIAKIKKNKNSKNEDQIKKYLIN